MTLLSEWVVSTVFLFVSLADTEVGAEDCDDEEDEKDVGIRH
jgi:hypothetical protein